jgi:hypothetical protein
MQCIGKTPAPLRDVKLGKTAHAHCPRLDAPGGHIVGLKCGVRASPDAMQRGSAMAVTDDGNRLESWASCAGISRAARKARRDWKAAAEPRHWRGFGMFILTSRAGREFRRGEGRPCCTRTLNSERATGKEEPQGGVARDVRMPALVLGRIAPGGAPGLPARRRAPRPRCDPGGHGKTGRRESGEPASAGHRA